MQGMELPPDELIDRVYEASVLPEYWPNVLGQFARAAQSREGVMVATNGGQLRWMSSSPAAEAFVQENYKHVGGMERTRRLLQKSCPAFVTDRDLFDEKELTLLPVYRDYLIPAGYGRGVATAVLMPDESRVIIHAEGDYKDGPYDPALIDYLNDLRPHLARSAMISARLAFERARTAIDTLAGIGLAACAVGAGGKVLVANAQFDDAFVHWTTRAGDGIALIDSRADQQLAASLKLLSSHTAVKSIALSATESAPPAVLHVVPIRRNAHDLFGQAAAILVLTTASTAVTRETALLQTLFDFTPAEASIAARVAAGQSLDWIAAKDGKSKETVRNQLKGVLAKTGCRRQLDLARLLTSLLPGEPRN